MDIRNVYKTKILPIQYVRLLGWSLSIQSVLRRLERLMFRIIEQIPYPYVRRVRFSFYNDGRWLANRFGSGYVQSFGFGSQVISKIFSTEKPRPVGDKWWLWDLDYEDHSSLIAHVDSVITLAIDGWLLCLAVTMTEDIANPWYSSEIGITNDIHT